MIIYLHVCVCVCVPPQTAQGRAQGLRKMILYLHTHVCVCDCISSADSARGSAGARQPSAAKATASDLADDEKAWQHTVHSVHTLHTDVDERGDGLLRPELQQPGVYGVVLGAGAPAQGMQGRAAMLELSLPQMPSASSTLLHTQRFSPQPATTWKTGEKERKARHNSAIPAWPAQASELRRGVNDTWNSFQCANKGRLVSAAEWKDARARLWAEHDEWIGGISEVSSCADRD